MKPGYKTTEFWFAFVAAVISLVSAAGILPDSFPLEEVETVAGGMVVIVFYILGRAWVKSAYLKPVEPTEDV